jgi:hypothetical protein
MRFEPVLLMSMLLVAIAPEGASAVELGARRLVFGIAFTLAVGLFLAGWIQ